DWDEGVLPFIETFLAVQTLYIATLPQNREPSGQEIRNALTRQGKPVWTEYDFQRLLQQLQWLGYGWLRPESVLKRMKQMVEDEAYTKGAKYINFHTMGVPPSAWQMKGKMAGKTTLAQVGVFSGHQTSVNAVCLSLDGQLAFSGSEDASVRIWE